MKNFITIEKGVTSLRMPCNAGGQMAHTDTSIFPFLKNYLTEYEYDFRTKRNNPKYYYFKYEKATGILYLPVNIHHLLEAYLNSKGIKHETVNLTPNSGADIIVVNSGVFEDRDDQKPAIQFLIETPGMKALELQTGCLAGDTIINFNHASRRFELPLKEAYERYNRLASSDNWDENVTTFVKSFTGICIRPHSIKAIVYSGIKKIYRVTLANGRFLRCTADHETMTHRGMIKAENIVGKRVMCDNPNYGIPEYSKAVAYEYEGEEPAYDICCNTPHHNFVANGIVTSNSGKTYVASRAIMEIGKRALVVVPASLAAQWEDALTSLCNANISILRGSKTIYDLVESNYETDTDIFLASVNTLQEYACGSTVYNVFPSMSRFMDNLNIGVKVVDECHINFNANTLIDIQANIRHNIYLSATYIRSSKNSNAIFKRIYPDDIRYGGNKYSRYVNITEIRYSLGPINQKFYSSNRGYSQFKYEKLIIRSPDKFRDLIRRVIKPAFDRYFINIRQRDQKLLFLVGLRDFAELLKMWCAEEYPDLSSEVFLHGTDESVLADTDIIFSTLGSAGTGRDLKGLKCVILFTSFSSESLSMQSLGRLRKLPNDETPEFLYMVNSGIESHRRHASFKQKLYKAAGKSFNIIDV